MEFRDDALQVFYVLEIVNTARARVDIGGPLIIDLPDRRAWGGGARGIVVNGDGRRRARHVTGPFAPGATPVQVAFRLRYRLARADVRADVAGRAAAGDRRRREGRTTSRCSSPQFASAADVTADGGDVFMLGTRPGPAGRRTDQGHALEPAGAQPGSPVRGAWTRRRCSPASASGWRSRSAPTLGEPVQALIRRRDTLLSASSRSSSRNGVRASIDRTTT